MLPVEQFPNSRFTDLGSFQVADAIAIGEHFEHVVADAAGEWNVRWIDTDTSDDMYGEIEAAGGDPDAHCCQQLQVFQPEIDPQSLLGSLTPLCVLPIEAAYFRIGDSCLKAIIEQQSAIGPLFDGVEASSVVRAQASTSEGTAEVRFTWQATSSVRS